MKIYRNYQKAPIILTFEDVLDSSEEVEVSKFLVFFTKTAFQIPFPAITFNNEIVHEFRFRRLLTYWGFRTPTPKYVRRFLKEDADE
jgi:hypothetical protein